MYLYVLGPQNLQPNCADFSKSTSESRCIECDPAKLGEYPWQAELSVGGYLLCGGSLITEKLVLTAAHCADLDNFETNVIVTLGHIDRSDDKQGKVSEKGNHKDIYQVKNFKRI